MDTITLVNRTTVLSDEDILNVLPALQAQVTEDFMPVWRIGATLNFVGKDDPVPAGAWALFHEDTTDTPGAGGYHLDDQGRVFGRVFVKDAMQAGEAWTVDASHELLEMLADPTAGTDKSKYVRLHGRWIGYQCLPEVCDAVEADKYAYTRPGADGKPVMLSDFVTPSYFWMGAQPHEQTHYAFQNMELRAPAPAVLLDGYLGIYDPRTDEWSQVSNFRLSTSRSKRHERMGRTRFAAGFNPMERVPLPPREPKDESKSKRKRRAA